MPHRALYKIASLPNATGDVQGGEGVLALEWDRNCDGVAYSQRGELTLYLPADQESYRTVQMASWEANDASQFRFLLTSKVNGQIVVEVDGHAARDHEDTIAVEYTEPRAEKRELAGRVVFPWQHMRFVFAEAQAGAQSTWSVILRGEAPVVDPTHVRVHILGRQPLHNLDRSNVEGDVTLLDEPAWRFVSAFFEDRNQIEPAFEMSETILQSGITTEVDLHYSYMTLEVRLVGIERLDMPNCN